MMHPHFYHWHNRVELKPETSVLQARWDAATKFSEAISSDTICALLRLALFGTIAPAFAKRFKDALIACEPTFPPENNFELLCVMATAALYSQMSTASVEADAVALGLAASAFSPDRIRPVCKELAQRATEYLESESERMRPTPKAESDYRALKKATETEDWATKPEATGLIGEALIDLGDSMERIAEENQYLWWLLGRRSPVLNTRREKLSSKEYALVVGAEAAERVALLPPPACVGSLIEEVLSQCAKATQTAIPLIDLVDTADIARLSATTARVEVGELCPLHSLLGVRRAGGRVDGASLEKLRLPAKLKFSPTDAANQYFHELIFLKALAQLD